MNRKQAILLTSILATLLGVHLVLSALHYYHLPIDGDYPRIGLPFRWYEEVMADPWGWLAVRDGKTYAGAGRYFCHAANYTWFHGVYAFIHSLITDPVKSVYLTTASAAMLVHVLFLWVVQGYTLVQKNPGWLTRVLLLLFSSVFIQYNQLYESIGLIDRSPSYIFFYGLPLMLMALYFMPLYRAYRWQKPVSIVWTTLACLFALPLALSSVLVQPIYFVACAVGALAWFHPKAATWRHFLTSRRVYIPLAVFLLCCLYAFYVARFNSEKNTSVALLERYALLFKGIWILVTRNFIWTLLLVAIALNTYLLKFLTPTLQQKIRYRGLVVLLFAVLYLGLLPLGGYRSYRPYIVRYDVLIPVTLAALYYLFNSSMSLLAHIAMPLKKHYAIGMGILMSVLFLANINLEPKAHEEQKQVFLHLMQQRDTLVPMPVHCNVGTWSTDDYKDPYIMDMLTRSFRTWGILQPYQTLQGPAK
ncbi:MAG: hypothetical protein ACR2IL_11410 [Chitinophagaceae bacterium]